MLDVLPATLVGEAGRRTARTALLAAGAWGLRPSAQELVASAREAGWHRTPSVITAFVDAAPWAEDWVATWRLAVDLLAAVHAEAPDRLGELLMFVLEAAAVAMPPVLAFQRITSLLLTAWEIGVFPRTYSNAFFQALVQEARALPPRLRPKAGTEIPLDVIDAIMGPIAQRSEEERFAVLLMMIRRLGPFDLADAWVRFVG